MKFKKQCLALLLALVLLVTGVPAVCAAFAVDEGACGDALLWQLDSSGLLTISGTGDMEAYETEADVPWAKYAAQITAVDISEGVTSIGGYAFNGCANLERVTLPETLRSIGEWAFNNCAMLQGVTLPAGLREIAWYAFYGCASLPEILIPDSVETIGSSAFAECVGLKSVALPARLTTIDYFLFSGCTGLTEITIPNTVTEIGGGAFYGCSYLKQVDLPRSVAAIGEISFFGCRRLERLAFFNGSCEIPDAANTVTATAVIAGYANSTAHDFAVVYERTFEEMPEIPEHDHVWENPVVTKEATCSEPGVLTFTCPICNETNDEELPTIAHTPVTTPKVPATCQTTGLTEGVHCGVCGAVITAQAILPKTGHAWKDTVTKAKIGSNGKVVSTCTVCKTTKTTKIYKINTVKLSETEYIADGTAKKPTVTVKDSNNKTLKKGTDYTLTYSSGRKAVGVYTVTVTFKGNYSGSKTLKFKILPGQVKNLKVTARAGRKFRLTWSKVTGAKKYAVYFCRTKNGNYTKLGTFSKNDITDGGFTAGVTYYFKVRAVTTVDGTNHFGAYSAIKSAKAKR